MDTDRDMKIEYGVVLKQLKAELDGMEDRRQALAASIAAMSRLVEGSAQEQLFPAVPSFSTSDPSVSEVRLPVIPPRSLFAYVADRRVPRLNEQVAGILYAAADRGDVHGWGDEAQEPDAARSVCALGAKAREAARARRELGAALPAGRRGLCALPPYGYALLAG